MSKIMTFESYHSSSNSKKEIKKGDLVLDISDSRNRVGLVISDKYKDEDGVEGFDVYFRMLNGDIFFEPEESIELWTEKDDSYAHVPSYLSIAKKNGYVFNMPSGYDEDGYLIEDEE